MADDCCPLSEPNDLVERGARIEGRPARANPALALLRQKFEGLYFVIGAQQQGHRGKLATRASINRRRMVAMEFGMCRSGRSGSASGSVMVGNGRLREERDVANC
jgi:hypothetical protein